MRVIEAGFYRVDITPPIGTPMGGYAARRGASKGIHDSLYARAVSLRDENGSWIVISLDLARVDKRLRERIAKIVEKETDIDERNIVVCATHTHSGPDVGGYFSDPDPFLYETVARRAAGAAVASLGDMGSVIGVAHSIGDARGVSINRRDPLAGPVDPHVHVLSLRRGGKKSITLSSFACHPVVLGHENLLFSADYPGELNRYVELIAGGHSLFFTGTAGDINPLTPTTKIDKTYHRGIGTFAEAEWMGKILACEAAKNVLLARPEEARISYAFRRVPIRTLLPENVEEERGALELGKKLLEKAVRAGDRRGELEARLTLWKARRILRLHETYGQGRGEVMVCALSFNRRLALVFLPGEVLVELGIKIKEKSPFPNTLVTAYSNEYPGYIPSQEAYLRGGYETKYPVCILERNEGDRIVGKCLEMLYELHRTYDSTS